MKLYEATKAVDDQSSFLSFVELLKKDREDSVRKEQLHLSNQLSSVNN